MTDISKILDEIKLIKQDLQEIKKGLSNSESIITDRIDNISRRIEQHENTVTERIEQIEKKQKKNNVVIFGLETNNYSVPELVKLVLSLFKERLNISVDERDLNNVYALGRSHKKPIAVEFISFLKKIEILKSTNKLKGSSIYINNDQTKTEQRINKILRKQLKLAKTVDPKAYIRGAKLHSGGEVYCVDDFPEDMQEPIVNPNVGLKSNSAPGTPIRATQANEEAAVEVDSNNSAPKEKKTLRSNSSSRSQVPSVGKVNKVKNK